MVTTPEGRSIGEHDWHSSDCVDWWIHRDLGRDANRRQQLRAMLSHAAIAADPKLAVLDIGGGYGVVSEEVLTVFPGSRVTLQDYSEPMLAAARERLTAHGARTTFVLADLTDPGWTSRVGGPFDLAVSAIAIHNLRDLGAIAACYRGVAQNLETRRGVSRLRFVLRRDWRRRASYRVASGGRVRSRRVPLAASTAGDIEGGQVWWIESDAWHLN